MAHRHGCLLVAHVFQPVALDNGRLLVVQPLLVTTIVLALPLGYYLTGQRVGRRLLDHRGRAPLPGGEGGEAEPFPRSVRSGR